MRLEIDVLEFIAVWLIMIVGGELLTWAWRRIRRRK